MNYTKEYHRIHCIHGIHTVRNLKIKNVEDDNKLETFLIEFRVLPHIEFLVRNTMLKLPSWKHTIICGNINHSYINKIFGNLDININIIKLDIDNLLPSDYSKLLMTENFWENFTGDKLLLYQEDTYLFNADNIADFLSYDYVGASWPIGQDDNAYGVGNGGFSLRDKNKMIECIRKVDPNKDLKIGNSTLNYMRNTNSTFIPEDVFFSKSLIDFNIGTVASRTVADKFSQETQKCVNTVGGHNFWLANNNRFFYTNLILDNDFFDSVPHRGGWKTVIKNLFHNNLCTHHKTKNSIIFVDCIESRFAWWAKTPKKPILEPWIGIFHYSTDLPKYIKDDLEYISNLDNVVDNLKTCMGIIVLSKNSYDYISHNPIYKDIKIHHLIHPIETIKDKFKMKKFMDNRDNWHIVQLGLQDRITSFIYTLKVKYSKIWLPGRQSWIDHLYTEISNLNLKIDIKSVKVLRFGNNEEYDAALQTNIVVIPLHGSSANNSVLEIIEMNIPAFVSKLPATIEYLGENYPLFFTKGEEIENIIDNEELLISKLIDGHNYLLNMNKEKFSFDKFNTDLYKIISG